MSKKQLPMLNAVKVNFTKSRLNENIMSRWDKTMVSAEEGSNTINIFDTIGDDYWGGGFTAKQLSAALAIIGPDADITVSINSPGGDMFEGAAIYNLLAQHKGYVTVNVLGLAASAASVIAMAGDTINISQVGFIMIHNSWGVLVGNRIDMQKAADIYESFDSAMADLYTSRTGMDKKKVQGLMDEETWLGGQDAIDNGFADELVTAKTSEVKTSEKKSQAMARRTLEMALSQKGFSRKERQDIFQKAFGERDATEVAARDAGLEEGLDSLLKTIKSCI